MLRKKQDLEMGAQPPECEYGRRQPHQFGTRWCPVWGISTNDRLGNQPASSANKVRNCLDKIKSIYIDLCDGSHDSIVVSNESGLVRVPGARQPMAVWIRLESRNRSEGWNFIPHPHASE